MHHPLVRYLANANADSLIGLKRSPLLNVLRIHVIKAIKAKEY